VKTILAETLIRNLEHNDETVNIFYPVSYDSNKQNTVHTSIAKQKAKHKQLLVT